MRQYFPFSYLYTMVSPLRCFSNRNYMNIWQILLLFLFLPALIMIPLSIDLANEDYLNFEAYFPQVEASLTDEVYQDLVEASDQGLSYSLEDQEVIISYHPDGLASSDKENGLLMSDDELVLMQDGRTFLISQGLDELDQADNAEDFKAQLFQLFSRDNWLSLQLTRIIMISLLVLLSFLIVVLGSSGILWLSKASNKIDIQNFKQALHIVLNCMGLPTLLASIYSILNPNISTVLLIQSLGFVVMLAVTYYKTQFNDEYTARQVKRN